jgi:hypothetical protein
VVRLVLLVALVHLLWPAAAGSEPALLVGTVGPAFTIELDDAGGTRVTHLDPGTYMLLVHDLSPGHNFHVIGPGLDDVVTTPEFVGNQTVSVTLVAGEYTYQCDPHSGEMSGGFTVWAVKPVAKKPAVKKPVGKKPKKKR